MPKRNETVFPGAVVKEWTVIQKAESYKTPSGWSKLYWLCAHKCGHRQNIRSQKLVDTHPRCEVCFPIESETKEREAKRRRNSKKEKSSIEKLGRRYILKSLGLPSSDVSAELERLKREQLTIHRLSKHVRKVKNESSNDPC